MSNFGKNIKKIRSLKKLSQTAFAELFNITRASVSAYEEGRSEPKSSKVLEIAKYFNISINDLLSKELTVNMLMNFSLPEEKKQKPSKTSQVTNVYKSYFKEVPFISANKQLDYIKYCQTPTLPFLFPNIHYPIASNGDLMVFEHHNDAMRLDSNGIFCGDLLFAKKIELKKFSNQDIIIVITKREIFTGRLVHFQTNLELSFDNLNFNQVSIPSKDILEIRKVEGVFSTQFNTALEVNKRLCHLETFLKK